VALSQPEHQNQASFIASRGLEVKLLFSTSGRGRNIFLDIPLYRTQVCALCSPLCEVDEFVKPILNEKTIQAILRHANVSTTNTYYIKSAADGTPAAMARLERLLMGNEPTTGEAKSRSCVSDNELATEPAGTEPAVLQ